MHQHSYGVAIGVQISKRVSLFTGCALHTHTQVDSAWNSGDREGAKRSADLAKKLNIAALISGIITIVGTIVAVIVIPIILTAGVLAAAGTSVAAAGTACSYDSVC